MNTDQIHHLFFGNIPTGLKKAQQRLKILHKQGRLKRFRPTIDEPFIYYTDKKKAQYEHQIIINWVYIWFISTLKNWEKLYRFDYAQNYGILECDAFVAKRNIWIGEHRFYFVECEVNSHLPFEKVKKYNRLYEEERYLDWWWVPLASGFPRILIVCTDQKRLNEVKQAMKQDNVNGLEFVIQSLDDLKGEIINESNCVVSTQTP